MNASHFYRAALHPQCTAYNSSPNEVISIASFEDGLNPACYRAVFHPFAQIAVPFDTYKKKEGLNIIPATMDIFKAQWGGGQMNLS